MKDDDLSEFEYDDSQSLSAESSPVTSQSFPIYAQKQSHSGGTIPQNVLSPDEAGGLIRAQVSGFPIAAFDPSSFVLRRFPREMVLYQLSEAEIDLYGRYGRRASQWLAAAWGAAGAGIALVAAYFQGSSSDRVSGIFLGAGALLVLLAPLFYFFLWRSESAEQERLKDSWTTGPVMRH